jgi:catechol 2,3-dioxygenase-like lactoylglutathione lyase family enzyme
MRLSNIILRVSDLGESVAFWRDLVGLDVRWSGDEFAFVAGGANQLTLNQPLVFEDQASDTEIVFEVEEVHPTVSAMRERGVPFEVEPRAVTSDGERTLYAAHFRDPDGHIASVTGWVGTE